MMISKSNSRRSKMRLIVRMLRVLKMRRNSLRGLTNRSKNRTSIRKRRRKRRKVGEDTVMIMMMRSLKRL